MQNAMLDVGDYIRLLSRKGIGVQNVPLYYIIIYLIILYICYKGTNNYVLNTVRVLFSN